MLTIELVPSPNWYANLRSLLKKSDWDKLRKATYKQAGYKCEVCGGRGPQWPVECHEIWGYDDENHIQKLIGLIGLCPSCHEVKHMGRTTNVGRGDIAAEHLARVNNWSKEQTEAYIAEQFKIWKERSNHDWILDLSWLGQWQIPIPEVEK